MIRKKWQILLSIVVVGLFCLAGCAGAGPAQSSVQELDVLSLAESVMDESDLLALAEGATEQSGLLTLAENATQESPLPTLVERRVRLFERILQRLDRTIERGQIAEERREQTLEHVRMSLGGNISEEQKAQILQRVAARIDKAIERGLFAEEHEAEILGRIAAGDVACEYEQDPASGAYWPRGYRPDYEQYFVLQPGVEFDLHRSRLPRCGV